MQALGVASYRSEGWKAAVDALNESLRFSKSADPSSGFFLAMAHWKLGDKEKARTRYEDATKDMKKLQPHKAELHRFRDEAAAVLGIDKEPRKKEENSTRP